MAVVRVSRALGSAAVAGGVDAVEMAVVGAAAVVGAMGMGREGAVEAPGTASGIPDTRVLWELRRKYEWLGGGRGLGARRERVLDAVLTAGGEEARERCVGASRQGERDRVYLSLWLPPHYLHDGSYTEYL